MTNRAKLKRLPMVLTELRRRAGHRSQSRAAAAIRQKTGSELSKAQLSKWELGRSMPSLESLLTFLEGLGYTLQDFQDELDRAWGETPRREASAAAPPADEADEPRSEPPDAGSPSPAEAELVGRIEALERRLRSLQEPGSDD